MVSGIAMGNVVVIVVVIAIAMTFVGIIVADILGTRQILWLIFDLSEQR